MTWDAVQLHDPTSESSPVMRPRATPPETLNSRTVALLDIGKIRSDEFLDTVEDRLRSRGLDVFRAAKPTNAKPAPRDVIDGVVENADVVVVALAD